MKEQEDAMHTIVIDELEMHLSGQASPSFYRHLDECAQCKSEVEAISGLSSSFAALRAEPDSVPLPSVAFYGRVAERINAQQNRSLWSLLTFSEPFLRRLAFACLMLLAGLGSYLVSQESSYIETDAATIIAQHRDAASVPTNSADPDHPATPTIQDVSDQSVPVHDQNYMLVTLANYRR